MLQQDSANLHAVVPRLSAGVQRLLRYPAYEQRAPLDALMRNHGLTRVIRLDNNEEFRGPSPRLAECFACLKELNRYPDGCDLALLAGLSRHLNVSPKRIALGTGSNHLLDAIGTVFAWPGSECVISQYAYSTFAKVAIQSCAAPVFVPARGWAHDLEAMAAAVRPGYTSLVFVANPNNPTGTFHPIDRIRDFLKTIPSQVLVVVDEAYIEYADNHRNNSAACLLGDFENLIVTRTFSKAYALAGLRIGYLAASEAVADAVRRTMQPFPLSTIALAAATAALADQEHVDAVITDNARRRDRARKALMAIGLDVPESHTNFLTITLPGSGADIAAALVRKGICVRTLEMYRMERQLRMTLGGDDEIDLLAVALSELVRPNPSALFGIGADTP